MADPAVDILNTFSADNSIQESSTLRRLKTEVLDEIPFTDYQFVDVVFGSAGVDKDIIHTLDVIAPDAVDYFLVRADRACSIYNDTTPTKRPWGIGYIILKCSVDNASTRILLIAKRTPDGTGAGTSVIPAGAATGGGSTSAITQLTGDVTAGPGTGSVVATIANGAVTEAKITLANNTTNNVTIAKHGFAPILPNDATKFLDGTGAYTIPGTSGGGGSAYIASGSGNPQGSVTGSVGVNYIDTVTGYNYRKLVGSGNTGWYYLPNRGAGLVNSLPHWSIRATEDWASTVVGACDGIDGHTSYAGASTSTSRQADDLYTQFASSTTAGNNGGTFAPNGFAVSRMKWAMDFDFAAKIMTDSSNSGVRYFIGLSDSDPSNSDTWGGHTIGFAFRAGTDTQWVGLTNDGSTQSVTANIAAIATSTAYILRIRLVSGVAYFSVNDGAETSKSTNIPTGASIPYWLWSANNSVGGGGSSKSIYMARMGCVYGTL